MLKRLYDRSEIGFAITWIVAYVVVMGGLRGNYGDESPALLIGMVAFTIASVLFLRATDTWQKYGLTTWPDGRRYLYFVPLVLLCTVNLWEGVSPRYEGLAQLRAMASLALAGWVEELVFRGFLFRAMEKESVTRAIIVSALTFGAGHIVNLFTGQASLDTFLQVAYASAIGFAFVMVFHTSGSLWPGILTHAIVNATSKLANQDMPAQTEALLTYGTAAFIIVVAGGYAWYLHKRAAQAPYARQA